MGLTLCEKIIKSHLVDGEYAPGNEVGIRIDQTLTQDATGTMAYLELEAMDIDKVKTELSVAYIDHNTLQTGFENANVVFVTHAPVMVFAIRFILKDLAYRAKLL